MQTLSLSGTWSIRSQDNAHRLSVSVPGTVFQALEKSGAIGKGGIFFGENNRRCLDLARKAYTFSRGFTLPASMAAGSDTRLVLEADGLDTLATITLNGKRLASTDNMHRRYAFDISRLARPGANTISIRFADTLSYIAARHRKRPLWPAQPGDTSAGANYIRKSHCSYGWDWGPQVPDAGIWRDIRVVAYQRGRLEALRVTQQHRRGSVTLTVSAPAVTWSAGRYTCRYKLTPPSGRAIEASGRPGACVRIRVPKPQLWWPNGYGSQPLYTLTAELLADGKQVHSISQRIGLRTIVVEQLQKRWGETFHFNVNGVAIFARGADFIPQDVCLARVTPQTTQRLIADCVAANYNMLRVWGGGVYPSDDFYDQCDASGIIVWQDLMFACKLYPAADQAFYDNVAAEVTDNLQRLRHHACLGLVCGNNEVEQAFEDWHIPQTKANRTEYLKLFEFLFPDVVAKVCPEVFYWPSSPSSGGSFEKPNSTEKGDCHYWSVWHGNMPFTDFRKHYFPFMSEYGFESLPSLKTVATYTRPQDRNLCSAVIEDHQRCGNGNEKILAYLAKYFRYPRDFASLVYVSQVSHAEAIRAGVEHWRRNRGRCMGSLYWQVNDNWPVTSWASIDHLGRWKAAHYTARRVYDHVVLSCDEHGTQARLHVSNERRAAVAGRVEWELRQLTGRLLRRGRLAVRVPALSSRKVVSLDFAAELAGERKRDMYLAFRFVERNGRAFHGSAVFAPYKHLHLTDPRLAVRVTGSNSRTTVKVTARGFAKFVELDLARHDAVFSDNFFDLGAGESRTVTIQRGDGLTAAMVKRELQVRSLYDTYSKG